MRIRSDLVGVVHVDGAVLAAGDEVPEGVTVGDHLVAAEKVKEADSGSTGRTRRRGNTSRATSDT